MKTLTKLSLLTICLFALNFSIYAQTSNLVSIDAQGKLTYTPDANGNIIPDFSNVGYHQGEKVIPDVPVKVTLNPGTGNRWAEIQNAIDSVAAMPQDANGHRGAILLTAGYYEVHDPFTITSSGVVIRGEGSDENGTIIEINDTNKVILFDFYGSDFAIIDTITKKAITDSYVPIGSKNICESYTWCEHYLYLQSG